MDIGIDLGRTRSPSELTDSDLRRAIAQEAGGETLQPWVWPPEDGQTTVGHAAPNRPLADDAPVLTWVKRLAGGRRRQPEQNNARRP